MSQPKHNYHLLEPSAWPITASFSALFLAFGALFFMHEKPAGNVFLAIGLLAVVASMYLWWKDVIKEGKQGDHTGEVQAGLRLGMALFILSELMFFFAFFWSFFKAAFIPEQVYGDDVDTMLDMVFSGAEGVWPPEGIKTLDPWDLPLINTLVLLLSGTTVTWAHYSLLNNDRKGLIQGLAISVGLGIFFSFMQAVEYGHAAFGITDGIYPSNFYLATGFHGAHVLIGTIFLGVCLYRAVKGDMTADNHLGFEFAAWYWHFVDVVWLFLFAFVYVWGG